MKSLRFLTSFALAAFVFSWDPVARAESAPAAPVATPVSGFVRSAEHTDKTTAAETLSEEFHPASGAGPSVWLVGVAHLGTPEYYKKLQARLDRQTVVLYEGVGIEDVKKGPGAATHGAGIQPELAKALGLVFQLDAIDYRRAHFINSDIKADKMQATVKERSAASPGKTDAEPSADQTMDMLMDAIKGEGQMGAMVNGFVTALGKSAAMQEMTKMILVEALGRAAEFIGVAQSSSPALKDLFDVILTQRNEVVLGDLRKQLAKLKPGQSIAIFYGAAHMDGIAQGLRNDLHYVPAHEEWDTAFTADPAKAGMSGVQVKMMLEMAKMQLKAMQPPAK